MFKKIMTAFLVSAMVVSTVGCARDTGNSKEDEKKTEPAFTEMMGDTVQYDPKAEVNKGEKITVDFWTWDFVDTFQNLIDQYESIHPNVTINLVETPWDDYWTKLPLALESKDAPAMFAIHNSYHNNLIDYMASYDIPLDDLRKDFLNIDSHVIDGKLYYMDFAMMTANLYYNKDLWKRPDSQTLISQRPGMN